MSSRPSLRNVPMPRRARIDPAEAFGGPAPAPGAPGPATPRYPEAVVPVSTNLVRARFLRRPRPNRADGRCAITLEVHPVLAGLLDEMAELLADRMGRKLRRAAIYDAALAVALRGLRDVAALVEADPDGRAIAADLVAWLESVGGLKALFAAPEEGAVPASASGADTG